MARTFVGNLVLRLQENVSAGAKKVAGALRGIDQAAQGLGKGASGVDRTRLSIERLSNAARRMSSEPWGANFQRQLDRLGAGARDIDRLRSSWDQLQQRIRAGGITGAMRTNEIAAWRHSVVSHFTAVRAAAKSTDAQVRATARGIRDALKPVATAAGLGTGAYVAGRLGRGGVTAASERQREYFRQEMASIPPGEREAIARRSAELSQAYPSIDATTIMEMARSARSTMGDTGRGLEVLDAMARGQVVLQSARGVDSASNMISRLVRGIDNLGQNSAGALGVQNTKDIIDGVIRAVQIEGRELDPGQLFDFARRAKIAGPGLDTNFVMNAAPAFMQDMTAQGFGTALSSAYQALVIGAKSVNSKATIAEQRRLGIRQGAGHGNLVDSEMYGRDPYSWVKKNLIPRLQADGVDLNSDTAIAESVAKLTNNTNASGFLTRMVQQREQIDRLMSLYEKAQGLSAAPNAAKGDPFVAYEGFLASLRNLSATVGESIMPVITPGLNALSGAINSLGAGFKGMSPEALTGLTVAAGAIAGLAGVKTVGGIASLIAAGPALTGAANDLKGAALALRGGGAAGEGKKGGGALGWIGSGVNSVLKFAGWAGFAYGVSEMIGYGPSNVMDAMRRRAGEAPGEQEQQKERRSSAIEELDRKIEENRGGPEIITRRLQERRDLLDRQNRNQPTNPTEGVSGPGRRSPVADNSGDRGASVAPQVDTTNIDAAKTAAQLAGSDIATALNVSAMPRVDTSAIQNALDVARMLVSTLQQAGSAAASANDRIGRAVRSAQYDYGVSP